MGEILEQAVNDSATQAMAEQGIQPVMPPKIEVTSFEDGTDLEYTMALELMPEIQPIDFSAMELERLTAEVDDAAIDLSLTDMATQFKRSVPIDEPRKSVSGDVLVIDFVGKVDGQPFDGGAAEDHHLELGSSQFIAGFEDQLIGLEPGDEKQVEVAFPDDYPNEPLAGKPAVFDVKVKELRERQAVEIDDALAESMGLENLAALRSAIRDRLTQEYASVARSRLKRQLLDKLADAHDFNVPPGMAEQEFENIWKQREEQLAQGAADPDEEIKNEEDIKAEYNSIAERRVRLGLLLNEVGRLNNIEVTQDEINRAIAAEAQRHPGHERKIYDLYRANPEGMAALRAPIFEEKVVDFMIEMANVTDRIVSFDELMRDPEADGEPVTEAKTKGKKTTKAKSAATKKAKQPPEG
jgi:trigger factor